MWNIHDNLPIGGGLSVPGITSQRLTKGLPNANDKRLRRHEFLHPIDDAAGTANEKHIGDHDNTKCLVERRILIKVHIDQLDCTEHLGCFGMLQRFAFQLKASGAPFCPEINDNRSF